MSAELNGAHAAHLMAGLALNGVAHVVASPGSRSTPLILAALARPDLKVHRLVDERVAGFFALGLARGQGAPVALICTSGSAGAHYLPALVEARQSHVPLVVLTADRPEELQGLGAPQTVPQQGYFGAHAGFTRHLEAPAAGVSPRWVATVAAQAVQRAHGVSHLNVAFREPLWSPEVPTPVVGEAPRHMSWPSAAPEPVIRQVARELAAGGPGVIVAGPMEPGRSGHAALSLARALGWPVIADPASQLRFDPEGRGHPALVTCADVLTRQPQAWFDAHGLAPRQALRLGRAPTSKFVTRWLAERCAGRTVLVDAHGDWHDPHASASLHLTASPGAVCRALEARLGAMRVQRSEAWARRWRVAELAARGAVERALTSGGEGDLWEGEVARRALSATPEGGLLHLASSMPIRDVDAFGAPELSSRRVRVCVSRGANGIDGTYATAMGEAVATEKPVVLLVGDVATLHDASGLLAARELEPRPNLTAVVVDNGGGGIFDFLPIAQGDPGLYRRFFRTEQQVPVEALARAAGVRCRVVEGGPALRDALEAATGAEGVDVIVARVPADGSNVARHRQAFAGIVAAVEAALTVEGGV